MKLNIEEKQVLTLDDILERSQEIDVLRDGENVKKIVAELKLAMKKKDLVALSAPAIGYNKRIFCIKFAEEIKTFINPIIAGAEGLQLSTETSELNPGQRYIVVRNPKIKVLYQRPQGQTESRELLGVAAYLFQQQLNLLDGVTVADLGLEVDDDFFNASEEERNEVINLFLDSLDLKNKEIKKDIEEDPEAKKVSDAIKFMEGVAKGEIKQELSE